jgi:hypothetical protein
VPPGSVTMSSWYSRPPPTSLTLESAEPLKSPLLK